MVDAGFKRGTVEVVEILEVVQVLRIVLHVELYVLLVEVAASASLRVEVAAI